jgi:hypothetical protein
MAASVAGFQLAVTYIKRNGFGLEWRPAMQNKVVFHILRMKLSYSARTMTAWATGVNSQNADPGLQAQRGNGLFHGLLKLGCCSDKRQPFFVASHLYLD